MPAPYQQERQPFSWTRNDTHLKQYVQLPPSESNTKYTNLQTIRFVFEPRNKPIIMKSGLQPRISLPRASEEGTFPIRVLHLQQKKQCQSRYDVPELQDPNQHFRIKGNGTKIYVASPKQRYNALYSI